MTPLYPIPELGAKGTFTLKTPFDKLILPDDLYTCMAVRNINDYIANNEDVLTQAYLNNNLTTTDYQSDLVANMAIASLQSQVGHWLYIPARFFISFPSSNGVPYHNVVIAVALGAMPVDLDLTFLKTNMSNMVIDSLGVTPNIKEVETSKVSAVPLAQDTLVKAKRASLITANSTDSGRYKALLVAHNDALAKLAALEAYILANRTKLGI